MPQIRNKKTGEIIEVPDNELGNYGIQAVQPQQDMGGMNITPEQAMSAQLMLPPQLATRVKNAYDIQQQQAENQRKIKEEQDKKQGAMELRNQALQTAEDLRERKYGAITGLKSIGLKIPGTSSQATLNKYKQLKSLLSLDNIKYLKGTGQISDKEQQLLQEASSSLEQNLSNKDFGSELDRIIEGLGGTKKNQVDKPLTQTLMENPFLQGLADYGQKVRTGMETSADALVNQAIPAFAATGGPEGGYKQNIQFLGNMAKGQVMDTAKTLVNPVGRAAEDPVGTFFSMLPFTGIVGKNMLYGGKPQPTAPTVPSEQVSTIRPEVPTPEMTPTGTTTIKPTAPKTVRPSLTENAAVNVYAKQFNIPSKIARERINPTKVSKQILEYGFEPTDLQGSKAIVDSVTGNNGYLTKMVREATLGVKTPIDIGSPLTSVAETSKYLGLTDDVAKTHIGAIRNIVQRNQIAPGQINADMALDSIKMLEEQGYAYKNASTKLSPNPQAEAVGKLYLTAADDLASQLDNAVGTEQLIESMKSPQNMGYLKSISPKLAEQVYKAKTLKDLRSIQAPFVKLGQMIDLTEATTTSPMSQLSSGILKSTLTGAGALGGSALGPVGGMAGATAGYMLSPALEAILGPYMSKAQQGIAKGLYNVGK